jgi:hypothetical protein
MNSSHSRDMVNATNSQFLLHYTAFGQIPPKPGLHTRVRGIFPWGRDYRLFIPGTKVPI